jgi:hypothetical protein
MKMPFAAKNLKFSPPSLIWLLNSLSLPGFALGSVSTKTGKTVKEPSSYAFPQTPSRIGNSFFNPHSP